MSTEASTIRTATPADLGAINDIYNHYVLHSNCTYQEESEPPEGRRQWFDRHGDRHPVIVAEEDGQVIGWGSLSPYHPRSAYRHTVENSVYVHHQLQRRGIGSLLLQDLITRAVIAPLLLGLMRNSLPASPCTQNFGLKKWAASNKSASNPAAGWT